MYGMDLCHNMGTDMMVILCVHGWIYEGIWVGAF